MNLLRVRDGFAVAMLAVAVAWVAQAAGKPSLTLLYTGNTNGQLEVCT